MSDILIVGGGLTGLLAARELRLAGAKVTVVERGELARESSWAGGGILSPLYPWRYPEAVTALAAWSQAHFGQLTAELAEVSGIDPEYVPSGLLVLAPEDKEAACRWAESHQVMMSEMNGVQSRVLEPGLATDLEEGLWLPQIGQVRNPRLLQALIKYLEHQGVVFRVGETVTGLSVDGDSICGVTTSAGEYKASQVLIAAGAWSRSILADVGISFPIEPVKGQMLLYKTPPGMIRHIVLSNGKYIIPRRDGHVLVGSTVERMGFDKTTTDEARRELVAAAGTIIPALADFEVTKHWAGLRPGSPEGVPCISAHPCIEGLYINAGHFRNGVVMGPASARLLADIILGRQPIVDPAPYKLME